MWERFVDGVTANAIPICIAGVVVLVLVLIIGYEFSKACDRAVRSEEDDQWR